MNKFQTVREIRKEINKVNKEIDVLIIKRMPYANLAVYHKALLSQMRRMSAPRSFVGRFGKLVGALTSLTF